MSDRPSPAMRQSESHALSGGGGEKVDCLVAKILPREQLMELSRIVNHESDILVSEGFRS